MEPTSPEGAPPKSESTPSRPPSARILGSRVDRISFRDTLNRVDALLTINGIHQLVTGNTLMLLEAERDPELHRVLDEAALVVPESSGVRWAFRWLGTPLKDLVPGIDLFVALCHLARDRRRTVFLLGARPGVAESAAQALQSLVPGLQLAGTHHGYFSQDEANKVLLKIRSSHPTFLFVALTVPEQEKWIFRYREALGVPIVMGVGGSFDVLSGRLKRAPLWMRKRGIEWLYRLIQEPWRWRRIAELPKFVLKVMFGERPSRLASSQ